MSADPVQADPRHSTVEFENDLLRALRICYGPHEKSVMHTHPAGFGVSLTDSRARFVLPAGTTEEHGFRAGEFFVAEAGTRAPENLSNEPFEVIQVEFKSAGVARVK